MPANRVSVTITMDPALRRELQERARMEHRAQSAIIELALRQYLSAPAWEPARCHVVEETHEWDPEAVAGNMDRIRRAVDPRPSTGTGPSRSDTSP